MLNRDRKEVIDAIIEYFSTKKNIYDCYDTMDLTDAINFNGELYSKEFEIWMNSEYVESYKLTQDEKNVLRALSKEYVWIARDNIDNDLRVYFGKPYRKYDIEKFSTQTPWKSGDMKLFKHLFKFINYENSPIMIENILKNCEVVDE